MTDMLAPEQSRRAFLARAGAGVAAAAAAGVAGGIATRPLPTEAAALASGLADINETARMVADLDRALAKRPEDRRWAMVIDARRCIGCHACAVACMAENNLPPTVAYRKVPEVEDGTYPDVRRWFMPTNCMQCEKPPCVPAANAVAPGAMRQRPDGIVEVDYARARGGEVLEATTKACPYTALHLDPGTNHGDGTPAVGPYEKRLVNEYGRAWSRAETAGAVRKCSFCVHRLDAGLLPACVSTCTGQAMHFGDLSDPASLAAELAATAGTFRLNADKGTMPRVLYVADRPEETCLSCHS
jgi:molybdopterin-containing oxidoreductase family iron-sulfur binding subunit